MKKQSKLFIIIAMLAITPLLSFGTPILAPGDSILAINANIAMRSFSNSPSDNKANPSNVVDGTTERKYMNYGGGGWDALYCGFIVTPVLGSSTIKSFTLSRPSNSTQQDRDPTTWIIYGTTDAILSINNSNGTAENWTLIDEGTISIPEAASSTSPPVLVNNSTPYTSYKMVFPALRNGYDNTMQVGEAAFYSTTDGTGANILSINDTNNIMGVQTAPGSKYPSGEAPNYVIDGDINTKYLNYGRENSGFIVTPTSGSSVVRAFEIWTAGDAPERDPTNWLIYGTTDAITSADNSRGLAENWTLIDQGYITLPEARNISGGIVPVNNISTAYTSYKMIFPDLKDTQAANSMQIADIQFDTVVPEPTVLLLLSLGGLALLLRK